MWDLGLKVGHSSRSIDELIRAAKEDLTIRTALVEARFVWGDRDLYDQAAARFDAEVVAGNARSFVAEQRSEEHTSELQSLMRISYAVFCLKKTTTNTTQDQ